MGKKYGHTFSWIKWDNIALPKKRGGWGIKYLDTFAKALAGNMGWQIITCHNLWTKVVTHKYIRPLSIMDWI